MITLPKERKYAVLTASLVGLVLSGCEITPPVGAPNSIWRLEKWEKVDSGTTEDLFDPYFVDAQTGYVSTARGLRETRDGGRTWQDKPDLKLSDLRPPASEDFALRADGIYRQVHGIGWINVFPTGQLCDMTTRSCGGDFTFIGADGWLIGSNLKQLYRTQDGGKSWSTVQMTSFQGLSLFEGYTNGKTRAKLEFVSNTRGWLLYNGKLHSTYDGGLSWHVQVPNGKVRTVANGIYMVSDADGWLVGSDGMMLRFSGQYLDKAAAQAILARSSVPVESM